MEEQYQTITTKNGLTYKRRKKAKTLCNNIYVRLKPEIRKKFEKIITKKNLNMSEQIRQLIENFVEENE